MDLVVIIFKDRSSRVIKHVYGINTYGNELVIATADPDEKDRYVRLSLHDIAAISVN